MPGFFFFFFFFIFSSEVTSLRDILTKKKFIDAFSR